MWRCAFWKNSVPHSPKRKEELQWRPGRCLGSQRAKPEGLMKGKHGLQKEEQKVHIGHTNQNTFGVYSASFLTYFAPHPSRIF